MTQTSDRNPLDPVGAAPAPWGEPTSSARLILADGAVFEGVGLGASGEAVGELCFNTAMTGYQEILTDPSYAEQIITFTFPHIGNVGTNREDIETSNPAAASGVRGCVLRANITNPSNYRAICDLDSWLQARGIIAISGLDTRGLTAHIREKGFANAVIAHDRQGKFDLDRLKSMASQWPGLEGMDLAKDVMCGQSYGWQDGIWSWDAGFAKGAAVETGPGDPLHVVAIDYGLKRNILRCLVSAGCRVTVVPGNAGAEDILARKPDGIFLSNGPGDPAATGTYAVPVIRQLVDSGLPLFGICLGHQMLALALGAETKKMHQGHHGANHPVMDHTTSKVEITSMNHGFMVDRDTLPDGVEETHVSLFDASNCGLRLSGKPVFSVQYHPEASPGPQDSHYLFRRFVNLMRTQKGLDPAQEQRPLAGSTG